MSLKFNFCSFANIKNNNVTSMTIPERISFREARNGAFVCADIVENDGFSQSLSQDKTSSLVGAFSGNINQSNLRAQSRIVEYTLHYFHANRQNVIDATNDIQAKLFNMVINCDNFGQGWLVGGTLTDTVNVEYGTFQSIHHAKIVFSITYAIPYALTTYKSATNLSVSESGLACVNLQSAPSSTNVVATLTYVDSVSTIATCRLTFTGLSNVTGYVLLTDSGAYAVGSQFSKFYRVSGAISGSPVYMWNGMRYSFSSTASLPAELGIMLTK